MAKDRAQKKSKDKWKEKTWYTILAPEYFGSKEIAVSLGSSPELMVDRNVEYSVSDLTGNLKKSNSKIVFRIVSCAGTKCSTAFVGHSVSDDYIKRMVRRRKERLDIVQTIYSADNSGMVCKLVIVTDGKLTNTKKLEIRKCAENFLQEKAKTLNYGDLVKYVIGDEIHNDLAEAAKNIYPIRKIEIRKTEAIGLPPSVQETYNEPPATDEPEKLEEAS
jgi:small subunit ribosomal protein S3Ae